MPLYDYRCDACEKRFELLIRSADVPACPVCGTQTVERLVCGIAPAGKFKAAAKSMRTAAARAGHLSNFAS